MAKRYVPVIITLILALTACAPRGGVSSPPLKATKAPVDAPAENQPEEAASQAGEEAAPTATETEIPEPTATDVPPTEIPPTDVPPTQEPTPEVPEEPVIVKPDDASSGAVDEAWQRVYDLPPGYPFSMTLTEAQIEARINEAIALSGYGENIEDIDVSLQNGQIGVYFAMGMTVGTREVKGSASVVFSVTVDSNGDLDVAVASAEVSTAVGSASVPPEMLAVFNQALEEAITGEAVAAQAGADVTFTEVVISGGAITISGYVSPDI